jgi:hypothetical protein
MSNKLYFYSAVRSNRAALFVLTPIEKTELAGSPITGVRGTYYCATAFTLAGLDGYCMGPSP